MTEWGILMENLSHQSPAFHQPISTINMSEERRNSIMEKNDAVISYLEQKGEARLFHSQHGTGMAKHLCSDAVRRLMKEGAVKSMQKDGLTFYSVVSN